MHNPPGASRVPHGAEGAVVFVEPGWMPPPDQPPIRVDSKHALRWQRVAGHLTCTLFDDGAVWVRLMRLDAREPFPASVREGAEVPVLSGGGSEDGAVYAAAGWILIAPPDPVGIAAGRQGATM